MGGIGLEKLYRATLIILGSRSLSENVLDVDHNIIEPWDAVGTHYNIQARRGGGGGGWVRKVPSLKL